MRPSLFISHGSPALIGEDIPAREFLAGLGRELGRPSAILVASAHWETSAPRASTATAPETIHDFYGFPEALYRLRYPAPGAPAAATKAVELLRRAGFAADTDATQGLDHGAWSPLLLMYPKADVPVAQISIQPPLGAAHHLALGRALAPLRADDVLVLGSGGATHNLAALDRGAHGAPPDWAVAFDTWLDEKLTSGDDAALADYRRQAPHARMAHPRDEHLLPALVAFGAAGEGVKARRLHDSFAHGSLSMAAYAFG
jgi:4,5-DOPA dioxygenase extradiol